MHRSPTTIRGRLGLIAAVLSIPAIGACTTFGSVRSAEVTPGVTVDVSAAASMPPGDEAAWFWSFDCAVRCDDPIVATDVTVTWGSGASDGPARYELGGGLSGTYPYLHGYAQLGRGRHPWGLGAQVGVPLGPGTWREDLVFGRFDLVLDDDRRLLFSPSLFRHGGNSPNGQNPGSFFAFAQGVGYEFRSGSAWVTPYVTGVVGRVDRESYGRVTEGSTVFAVVGLSYAFR